MNQWLRKLLLCSLLAVLTACESSSRIPHVDGTWIGLLDEVLVYDARGNSYTAAILKVESGPALPLMVGELDPHHPAILAWDVNHLARLIDPATLPLDKRVEVRGMRIGVDVWKRREDEPFGDVAVHRVKGIDIPGADEDVIVVYHPVRVLPKTAARR